jgi:hypothetical protein
MNEGDKQAQSELLRQLRETEAWVSHPYNTGLTDDYKQACEDIGRWRTMLGLPTND